jgi:hypothetical protein
MSIEQRQDFHVVRRLLKVIAPDFRLLASTALAPGDSVVDVRRRTIEVGESTEIMQAVGSLLFQIGHLILHNTHPDFGIFFGRGLDQYEGKEDELVDKLSELGVEADRFASFWAKEIFKSYWPIKEEKVDEIIDDYCMDREQWKKYWA